MSSLVDKQFEKLKEDYLGIIFGECPGSRNDEAWVKATALLRNNGIKTRFLPLLLNQGLSIYSSQEIQERETLEVQLLLVSRAMEKNQQQNILLLTLSINCKLISAIFVDVL